MAQSISNLKTKLASFKEHNARADKFLELADRDTDFTELITPMRNEFVEKIVVQAPDKKRYPHPTKRVDIYFDFI